MSPLQKGFTIQGRYDISPDGECLLFPSKDQRDLSKFNVKKTKFDPNTLQPFDKVLVRDGYDFVWLCALYSYYDSSAKSYKHRCVDSFYKYCIPYNEETKHLIGKADEAPEFYRYWEE